jgi:UDP-GlcNAc:undecaprenyl-phosphate GlcNAc-1-phosphate transferase
MDILQVIRARIQQGKNIFSADNNHLHHRLLQIGLTTRRILSVLYTAAFLLGVSSILMLQLSLLQSLIFFCVLGGMLVIVFYVISAASDTIAKQDETIKKILSNSLNNSKMVTRKKRLPNSKHEEIIVDTKLIC